MQTSIPKTVGAGILATVAYWIVFLVGAVILAMKNGNGVEGDGITVEKLIQDTAVSGMAAAPSPRSTTRQ